MTWKEEVVAKGEQRLTELDTAVQDLEDQLKNAKAEYAEVLKTLDGLGWNHRPVKIEVRGKAITQDGQFEAFTYSGRPYRLRADLIKQLGLKLGDEFCHDEAAAILQEPGLTRGAAMCRATVYLTYLRQKGVVEKVGRRFRRVRPKEPRIRQTIEDGPPFSIEKAEPRGYGQ